MPAGRGWQAPRESRCRASGATHVGAGTGLVGKSVRFPDALLDDRRGQARSSPHGGHGFSEWRGFGGISRHRQRAQLLTMEQDSGDPGIL